MVRTRFAPSPTGSLHVGNARIAVLNWLFTRHENGAFLLRIEDTDAERNLDYSEDAIHEDLRWLGIEPDEGPLQGGSAGPYRQSERIALYQSKASELAANDRAYPCFCTQAELDAERAAAVAAGGQPHYSGRCRRLTPADRAARAADGTSYALRFAVPGNHTITFTDIVRGEIRVHSAEIGDFIILRSDGIPTYNFAVVVDDMAMRITHVIRGTGHLSNTPRQVLLYESYGAAAPAFVHVPTVLGEDRQKLSKRNGAQAVADYRAAGYHPDALVNYLSLLAWSSPNGDEFLTREQLVQQISLERIGAADVVFDPAKLRWLSGRHIERMPLPDLATAVRPFLDARYTALDAATLDTALAAVRTHLHTFADVNEALAPLFAAPVDGMRLSDEQRSVTAAAADVLPGIAWSETELAAALKTIAARAGVKGRALYEPLRLAVTGEAHGPPFIPLLLVRGREDVIRRIQEIR